jgi:hypothetical protein
MVFLNQRSHLPGGAQPRVPWSASPLKAMMAIKGVQETSILRWQNLAISGSWFISYNHIICTHISNISYSYIQWYNVYHTLHISNCISYCISYNYIIQFISNESLHSVHNLRNSRRPFFFASLLTPPVFRSQEDRPIKVCNGKEEHHDETVEGPADVTKDCRCWSRRDFWMTKIFRFFFVVEQVET